MRTPACRAATTLLLAAIGFGTACADDPTQTLDVFAASSLTDAFTEIEASFEAENPDVDVVLNLASSSSLREQILAGAPADVFAAANEAVMTDIALDRSVDATVFAKNRLAIAVPVGNPGGVRGLEDFARSELLLGLCAEGVPCGDLAQSALAFAGIEPQPDTEEADVRALLTRIEADELDAGIVYRSDVVMNPAVEALSVPPETHLAAAYPIAALTDDPLALAFIDHVMTEGVDILDANGFESP